jgi:hypothetical protein
VVPLLYSKDIPAFCFDMHLFVLVQNKSHCPL